MTDLIVKDLQKQDPGSALVELFELKLDSSNTVYFHSGVEEDLSTVQFREEGGTIRTYTALPLQAKGFKSDPSATSARPTITFANVSDTFKTAISDYDALLGATLTRRTTLQKYLVGESGDSTPPVEFPKQIYLFDRITAQSKTAITFECATPYDLQGVTLPKRQVIANACPWLYQGADYTLNEYEKIGACSWNRESKYKAAYKTALNGGTEYIALATLDDEYVVPGTGEIGAVTFSSTVSSLTANNYYTTNTTLGGTVRRLKKDGSIDTSVDGNTVPNYWQAITSSAIPGTITDGNALVKRVRIWDTYSASTTYYAYTDDRYNDFVRYTSGGLTKLWKAKRTSVGQTPEFGEYWEPGDVCSKTLTGCKMRYGFDPISIGTASSTGKGKPSTEVVLPFGGFPGSRKFS
jgi:lambda family phage minor tail protein L